MSKIIQNLLQLIAKAGARDANARQIAKHLAKNFLYERTGIDALYPDVKDKYLRLKEAMADRGHPIRLSEGVRTALRQDEYYARVPKTTYARGLQSYHQYGLAIDVISAQTGWKAPTEFWDALKEEGIKLGLTHLGDWDKAHFEWHPGFVWEELEKYFSN